MMYLPYDVPVQYCSCDFIIPYSLLYCFFRFRVITVLDPAEDKQSAILARLNASDFLTNERRGSSACIPNHCYLTLAPCVLDY